MAPPSTVPFSVSSSSTSSTTDNPTNPINLPLQNITNFIPIKLKENNYILWKTLFLPVLRSFDMEKFIDGTSSCPPKLIRSSNTLETLTINPDYLSWIKADQTLLIWMNATISEEILPYVIGSSNSRSLWVTLENRLAHLSRSHILQLKSRLQTIQKGDSTIDIYLQQIKEITDNLAEAGHLVDDLDLVFHILNGLPSDYDSFNTSIRIRDPPVTSDVLHNLLLSEELNINNRMRRLGSAIDSSTQAFNTYPSRLPSSSQRGFQQYPSNRGRGKSFMRTSNSQSQHQRNHPFPTPENNHLYTQNKHFSQNFSTNYTKPVCQICQKPNHSALDCFHRMNFAYAGRQPPHKLQAMAANTSPNPSNTNSSKWVLDSGASSHLTHDLSQMDLHSPYKGTDQIQTASGDYLPISNIGQCFGEDTFPRST